MTMDRIVYVVENEGVPDVVCLDRQKFVDLGWGEGIVEYVPRPEDGSVPKSEFDGLQARYYRLLGAAKRNLAIDRRAELERNLMRQCESLGQDARISANIEATRALLEAMRSEVEFRRLLDSLPDPNDGDGSLCEPEEPVPNHALARDCARFNGADCPMPETTAIGLCPRFCRFFSRRGEQ